MVDGGIVDVWTDTEYYNGYCDTCDYGSSYINEFEITLRNMEISIKIDDMYEYAMSEGDLMKMLLINNDHLKTLTEDGFSEWLSVEIRKVVDCDVEYVVDKVVR